MWNPFHRRDYERFESLGLVIEREGRFVRMASTLDASSHAEMRRKLGESVSEIEESISSQVDDLYKVLHRYQPECVLGALWFRNGPKGPAAASPNQASSDIILAHVEYLAILYLRDRGEGTEFAVLPHVVEDIQVRVTSLFITTVWLWMAQDAARHGARKPDSSRDLWFMALMNSLFVRYHGHFDHMRQMLLAIEGEMAQDLTRLLGWSIADAVAVGDSIIDLIDDRLNANLARGDEEAEKIWTAAWPRGRGPLARTVKRFLPLHLRPWLRKRLYGITAWVSFLMQDATTFTVSELANATELARSRIASLMKAASLPWGSCQESYFRFPHPTPPILSKPCIELGDERYLVPVPTSFSWAVRGLVEESLKSLDRGSQAHCWDAYERARASFTEKETVGVMSRALPHAGAFHSLKYSWVQEGETVQGEIDGLLLADDTAILVEVKSGTLSPQARRGAPDRLREQLEDLVGKAYEQARKAREFLQSAPTVVFRSTRGELQVQSERINSFVLVTVSLDPLDMFTTNLNQLADLGVLGDHDLPWAVSYLDLVVIMDALEFPAQLLHYLQRRQRVNELGFVVAHDELDWFGHYLEEGLFFDHMRDEAENQQGKFSFTIVGYSAPLDAHYMHDERYKIERPPVPRQPMPDSMRELLQELEEGQHHGYLHLSLALLDLDWKAREEFFAGATEVIKRTRTDGEIHDFTLVLNEGQSGLTFMSDSDRASLQKGLFSYCQMKKYQMRASSWVGIGKLVDSDNWVDDAIAIEHPWEYDEKLEELLSATLDAPGLRR